MSNPKYPIYVISKGRWESRLTSKALERMQVPYRIVIEPQEFNQYSTVIDEKKIICLPFSNLGQGSIPARNFVFEHAIAEGNRRHWILDDNINGFVRLNNRKRIPVGDGTIFLAAENFVDRYVNVAMAGFQYRFFAGGNRPPFALNTRIYSCILLDNSIPHRWRGKYNEDTDLSIRVLKDGYCTILFYAFLCNKSATMKMRGGNSDALYAQTENFDGRLEMAKSLVEQHPDIVRITHRWGRWQHLVDYSRFKNNSLIRRADLHLENTTNNYGMRIVSK